EDSTIFKQKLTEISWLTAAQLKQLGQLRYRGWGQLSRKLLTGLKDDNNRSIMDGLWETNANFMQLRSQPAIENQIKSANQANLTTADLQDTINELYTSPQNKKAIREVMVVLADIKDAMHGQTPNWIFVEAARGGGVA
ncbi:CRISPR-associated endonuclease Cas9 REC1/REC2 domain-containing protein, partial [Streptomyces brasiliscabiei]